MNKTEKWLKDNLAVPSSCSLAKSNWRPIMRDDHGQTIGKIELWAESSKPQRCPVCNGRGTVPMGFYNHTYDGRSSSAAEPPTEPCRSCDGKGLVWR